jgi:hypothetical protein
MKAPERLNVLVSRARDCLVLIGNRETFVASAQGNETWVPFFRLMEKNRYIQNGLSIRCEQHLDREITLSNPNDFDVKCPDGGCSEDRDMKLKCGKHTCLRKCHRLTYHNNGVCTRLVPKICEKKHEYTVECKESHTDCSQCRKEEEEIRKRAKREFQIEQAQQAQQAIYRQRIQETRDEIAQER